MNGLIDLESRENEFTKFTVTIPVRRRFKIDRETLKSLKPELAQNLHTQDDEDSVIELDINKL